MHFTILAIAATPIDACRYFILFGRIQFAHKRPDCALRAHVAVLNQPA
jgi:hypothetical protein